MEVFLTLLGIVGPAWLIVAATRKWLEPVSWRLAALLLALTLACLGAAVFTPHLPLPLDEVARGYPYRGVVGKVEVKNPLVNETVRQVLPWMQAVREAFSEGRAPLWNAYSYSGYPLLGSAQSAPFSPFFLLTLFVPLPKQVVAMAGLKIFVALLFTVLLLRSERVTSAAAVVGAAYFAFSVFQTVWLYYPMTNVTTLFPALLFTVVKVLRSASASAVVALALVTAAALTGGHPESVLHAALGTFFFLLVESTTSEGRRRLWGSSFPLALAVLAGLLLAAPAWLPFCEQVFESSRFAAGHAQARAAPPMPVEGLAQLVNPDHFGNPARGGWSWIKNYAETAPSYLGLLPLALLVVPVFSPRAERRDRALLAALVVVLLIAWNWTPIGHLLNRLPPLSLMANGRLRFVAALFAAVLAARSLHRFRRPDALCALAGTLAVVAGFAWAARGQIPQTLASQGAAGLIPVAGLWAAYAVKLRRRELSLAAVLAPLVIVELFTINTAFNAITDRRLFAPRLPIVEALRSHAPKAQPFRVVGAEWSLLPDGSTWYGLEDIRGNDPMAFGHYLEFLDVVTTTDPRHGTRLVRRLPQPELDFLNVRYVLTAPNRRLSKAFRLLYKGPDGRLYENPDALPRFFVPRSWRPRQEVPLADQLRKITDYRDVVLLDEPSGPPQTVNGSVDRLAVEDDRLGTFRLRLVAKGETLVASSVPNCPGWTLSVNGHRQRIRTVNGAFVGFFVAAGPSDVILRYWPVSYTVGIIALGLGLGLLVMIKRLVQGAVKPHLGAPSRGGRPRAQDVLEGRSDL